MSAEDAALRRAARAAAAALAEEEGAAAALVARGHRLPLQFEGLEDEVNFLGVLSMLDFGSGFARELELAMQEDPRPFEEIVIFGVMHMHISGVALDADGLRGANAFGIEQHFGISSTVEEEALGGAVRASVPGPLKPLVDLMLKTMHTTGAKLVDLDCKSLGHFIVSRCREQGPDLDAAAAVRLLADTFGDVFDDSIPAELAGPAAAESELAGALLPGRKAVRFLERIDDRFYEELAPGEPAEPLRYLLKDLAAKLPVKADAGLIAGMRALGLDFKLDDGEEALAPGVLVLDMSDPQDAAREQLLRAKAWAHAKALLAQPELADKRVTARQLDAFVRRALRDQHQEEVEKKQAADQGAEVKLFVQGTMHY